MPQYLGSSATLSGAATYTSKWVNTNTWATVSGTVFSDQSGTLHIEQSGDGASVDTDTSLAYTANAVTANSYNVTLLLPYVRLRYVNGATPQTAFRLYSRFILGNST